MAETADAHWALANWCEHEGLKAEAIAHYTAVTRLDPNHAEAWAQLGCRKVGNRWLSEAQIKADKAEADAQNAADVKWRTRLRLWWKEWLAADPQGRLQLEQDIAQELEPRAVRSIRALFSTVRPSSNRSPCGCTSILIRPRPPATSRIWPSSTIIRIPARARSKP